MERGGALGPLLASSGSFKLSPNTIHDAETAFVSSVYFTPAAILGLDKRYVQNAPDKHPKIAKDAPKRHPIFLNEMRQQERLVLHDPV